MTPDDTCWWMTRITDDTGRPERHLDGSCWRTMPDDRTTAGRLPSVDDWTTDDPDDSCWRTTPDDRTTAGRLPSVDDTGRPDDGRHLSEDPG